MSGLIDDLKVYLMKGWCVEDALIVVINDYLERLHVRASGKRAK